MNIQSMSTFFKRVVHQRNIFFLFSSILLVVVCIETVMLSARKEKIVIVPTNGHSYWINGDNVSDSYIDGMGTFLTDLLLNKSPADVSWKMQKILQHVHPNYYHKVKKKLSEEKELINKQGQSYVFRPTRSHIDRTNKLFFIEGTSFLYIGQEGKMSSCAHQRNVEIVLKFESQNGHLLLTSLKQKELDS
ncbi:MAG: TraE/TraK family type IV conjugative transfer system protein [Rhabdochlamydiaceae bacterium]|nr:TraE/TraK family type IV conjugative transfer system protein [Candidatus Amphrikana amoebophyrae]